MNNGQLNSVSLQAIVPFVTQNPAATITIDGEQKQAGDFAGVLGGLQYFAAAKESLAAGHAESIQLALGMDQNTVDAGVEQRSADLLALFQMPQINTPALTALPTPLNSDAPEADGHTEKVAPQSNEASNVMPQMALAAYVQSGRIPDVNILTVLPVDRLQKEATQALINPVTLSVEPQAVTQTPPVEKMMVIPAGTDGVGHAQPRNAAPHILHASQPLSSVSVPDINKESKLPVEPQQKVAIASEQPAVVSVSAVTPQLEGVTVWQALQEVALQSQEVPEAQQHVVERAIVQNQQSHAESDGTADVASQPATATDVIQVKTAQILPQVNKLTRLVADTPQEITVAVQQPTATSPVITNNPEHAVQEFVQQAEPKLESVERQNEQHVTEPVVDQKRNAQHEAIRAVVFDRPSAISGLAEIVVPMDGMDNAVAVSKLTQFSVEALQNGDSTKKQRSDIADPVVTRKPEQPAVDRSQSAAPALKPALVQSEQMNAVPVEVQGLSPQPEKTGYVLDGDTIVGVPAIQADSIRNIPEAHKAIPRDAGMLQNAVTISEQPVVTATPVVHETPEPAVSAPVLTSTVTVAEKNGVEPAAIQNPLVNNDTLQTVVAENKPFTVVPTIQMGVPSSTTEVNESAPLPVDRLQATSATKELTTHPQTTSIPIIARESELDIQLSQPLPITTRVSSVPAMAVQRSTGLGSQHLILESRIETVRGGTEKSVVKEMTSTLQPVALSAESMIDSGSSGSFEEYQGQSDSTTDNQQLSQNMRGQLVPEHQKVVSTPGKLAQPEFVRQDVPEQVMQQVKERLVQHDVKAGSQQITLTLSPDSLGELKVNLNLQGQKLSVEIVTENRSVRDVIIQHTDALKESLARQNITMESFDVTTGGKGSSQGQNQNAWRELAKQQQQQQAWASPRNYNIAHADLPSGPATYQKPLGQSILDIHY